MLTTYGAIVLEKPGAISIPTEVDHLLRDRKSWVKHFKPKLQYSNERINWKKLEALKSRNTEREDPLGLFCGSLFGQIRNMMGLEAISYLYVDDEALYDEMIGAVAELCFKVTENILSSGVQFDFAHFWEDIAFKTGPLISPSIFEEKIGPGYRRITELVNSRGIDLVSVDCDGKIDDLVPCWINNGVNTMFPIEVGTWQADILPWKKKFGRELRGVGGMNKHVFAEDYSAIDSEIERLKPLVGMGGFIPCPDHRIPPTAKWDNVRYYCDKMKQTL